MNALCGNDVYRIAVAPLGAAAWRYRTRKGGAMKDLWGVCETYGDSPLTMFIKHGSNSSEFVADRERFNSFAGVMEAHKRGSAAELRRSVRSRLLSALAGPAAEQIAAGEADPWLDEGHSWGPEDDIYRARLCSYLLPWRNEFDFAAELVVATLRRPNVWAAVIRVADALERRGSLTRELPKLLPERQPKWPPSPRSRAAK